MTKSRFFLFPTEKDSLHEIERKDGDWRARLRAKTLLLLAEGKNAVEVGEILQIHPKTVRQTCARWQEEKFGMLHDKLRPGAPKKLTEQERQRLHQWAQDEPLNSHQLLAKHLQAGGQPVHFNTIVNELKELGMVWKRTRHSLKKKRDEQAFQQAAIELEVATEMAERGEIVMGYLDEAGFSCVHPNRNAWTVRAQQHLVGAVRGQRLNVLAALMSTGDLPHVCFEKSMTSDLFVDFLTDIAQKYDKPILIVLDNASVHTANKIKLQLKDLKSKGVHLYFLPPYSPELNRIENFWRQVKHVWMDIKNRTIATLKKDVKHIMENFGSKFNFSFS